jgi:hypothetical protein
MKVQRSNDIEFTVVATICYRNLLQQLIMGKGSEAKTLQKKTLTNSTHPSVQDYTREG